MSYRLAFGVALPMALLSSTAIVAAADGSVAPVMTNFTISMLTAGYDYYQANNAPSVVPADADKATRQIGALVDRYHRDMKSNAAAADISKATGELIIGTAVIAGASTGVGSVPTVIVGSLATWGNNAFADHFRKEGEEAAKGVLANSLKEWDSSSPVKYDDIRKMIADDKADEAAARFHEVAGALSFMNGEIAGFDGGKELAEKLLFQTIMDTERASLEKIGENSADIKALQGTLKANKDLMDRAYTRIGQVGDRLTTVETELKSSLSSMERLGRSNEQQLGMISDVLYGQQSTAVKLEMLKDPKVKPGLTGEARSDVIQVLKTQKMKEEIIQDTGRIVGNAQDINSILKSVNLGSPEIDAAVGYANVAQKAMEQALNGNYIGAIAGALNVFGGSKPDPEQQRFNAIMGRLDQIDQKLTTVIELQQKTLSAIDGLSKQLVQVEERLNKRLDIMQTEARYTAANVRNLMWKPYESCETAYSFRNGGDRSKSAFGYNESNHSFASTSDLLQFMSYRGKEALDCASRLESLFQSIKNNVVFGNSLSLRGANYTDFAIEPEDKKAAGDLQVFLEDLNGRAISVFEASWKKEWGSPVNALAMLGSPAASTDAVAARLDSMGQIKDRSACSKDTLLSARLRTFFCSTVSGVQDAPNQIDAADEARASSRFRPLMNDPILRDQIPTLIRWAAFAAQPYDLRKGTMGDYYGSIGELLQNGHPYGKDLLLSAMNVVDIALGQQALLHGDITAKFVYDILWDKTTKLPRLQPEIKPGSNPVRENAAALFSNPNNPWLAENVLMFSMDAALKAEMKNGDIRASYQAALAPFFDERLSAEQRQYVGRTFLKSMFDFSDDVEYLVREDNSAQKTKRVYISFPYAPKWTSPRGTIAPEDVTVRMPTPDEFYNRSLSYPETLFALMRDREMLAERYVDYELLQELQQQDDADVLTSVLTHGMRAQFGGETVGGTRQ